MNKNWLALLLAPVCLAACISGKHKHAHPATVALDTVEVKAKKGPMEYQATPTKTWEITHTDIALTFDFMGKTARCHEKIALHPYCFATDTLVLDAKSLKVDSATFRTEEGQFMPVAYVQDNETLKITFDRRYRSTESLTLNLVYTAMPYASPTGGSKAITEDRGLYFINTDHTNRLKPVEIWTQGETEANSHWLITIDKPNTRFTTHIELTVPDSMTTLSNGAMVLQTDAGNHMRTDIWEMNLPIQAYVAMFAIGNFSTVHDTWHGKAVDYLVEPEYAPYARGMFSNTPEMLECFSKATGVPYPWNKYSQVVARDYVSGAMENTSATLLGEFMNENDRELKDGGREDVVAHELFHQWFGDYATCESWSNLTVNESFANYGEQIWRRYKYGTDNAQELAYADLEKYIGYSRRNDPQLVRFYYDSREDMFDPVTYNKGGAILHYINGLIGDTAFHLAMKTYLTDNALKSAEAHNWRMALEKATGTDWNPFFNQWYFHPGHPVLNIDYREDDSLQRLRVVITQAQFDGKFYYTLPLKVALYTDGRTTEQDVTVSKPTDTLYFPYQNGHAPVVVPDADHIVPAELVESGLPDATILARYRYGTDYVTRKMALQTASNRVGDTVMQSIIGLALSDPIPSLRRSAVSAIKGTQSVYYKQIWGAKIREMAAADPDNMTRAEAVTLLGAWRDTASRSLFLNGVNDNSYAVAGAALEALYKMDTGAGRLLARNLVYAAPRSFLESEIWSIIAQEGRPADTALFTAKFDSMNASNSKYVYLSGMQSYFSSCQQPAARSAALKLFAQATVLLTQKSLRLRYGLAAAKLGEATDGGNKENFTNGAKDIVAALDYIIAREPDSEVRTKLEKKKTELSDGK